MYLDPGVWSMTLQVLVGAAIAVPALIGIFWGRISQRLFKKRKADVEKVP